MNDRRSVFNTQLGQGLILLALAALLTTIVACSVTGPSRQVDYSGSNDAMSIAQEFKAFYEENGGLRVFGFPLTEAYVDSESQRLIQYFQQLRLEYDQERDQVVVTPLGQWALNEQSTAIADRLAEEQAMGPEERGEWPVEDAFLTFYESYGSESVFGRPISDQIDVGGTRAQYFENARLDWRPEAPLDYRVQPGRLGEAHYRLVGIFKYPGRSRPLDSAGVRQADVSATFRAPILYSGEDQTLYVDVKTPEGQRPVASVAVAATVYYNNGQAKTIDLVETDGTGHTNGELTLEDLLPGQKVRVVIEASSPGGSVIGTTSKSFKSWW